MSVILNKLKKEAIIYCPLCNKEYRPVNLQIVEKAGETILAHSNCPSCQGAILSLVYKNMLGITLVGLVTDLNYEDALRLKNEDGVNENDVLEIYNKLQLTN